MCKTITKEKIDKELEKIKETKYEQEEKFIKEVFKKIPRNDNKSFVAAKISLIDLVYGTNLLKNLGKEGGLNKLAEEITKIDFDKRVKEGDTELVNDLVKFTKDKIGKNLSSFISKYCVCHNYYCYNKDDYVIYDDVLCTHIPEYLTKEEGKELVNKWITKKGKKLVNRGVTKNYLKNLLKENKDEEYKYEEYKKIIDKVIEKNNLREEFSDPHRKVDWYIWNKYRPK